jgi:4-carboxymuconolactone decarboxylase
MTPEAASAAASEVGLVPAFAELNIFRALLHRPTTAKALADLLVSLLFRGELDDRLRELLILRIGWVTGSDYEWTQHWTIALERFGCTEADLLAVRSWRESEHFGEHEKTILEAVDELLETGDLGTGLFERCLDLYGRNATIELVTAVGTWRLVSKLTKALAVPLEDGVVSWPPDGTQP